MESSSTQQRIAKRSIYACSRCRRHKIKCSGVHPCNNCAQRRLVCTFDERDNKVLVTQAYLSELHQKIARLERLQTGACAEQASRTEEASRRGEGSIESFANQEVQSGDASRHDEQRGQDYHSPGPARRDSQPPRTEPDSDEPDLTNPLTASPSRYCLSASNGMAYFLAPSSNWSFLRQVLSVTHQHVCQSPLPTNSLLYDGCAYDLGWNGSRTGQALDNRLIPNKDHAIYLINAVKFHCGQMFHLFDEEDFTTSMQNFYTKSSAIRAQDTSLWYIHFLVILAFGKSLTHRRVEDKRPSGAEFFVRALQLLPDVKALCKEPILSSEILCSIALYYQALDFRHASHSYIVQAKSIAMNHGMHTDMPIMDLGPELVQRCRKIWWTAYVLDRQMSSLMGLPQSTSDEGICCQLPSYPDSTQRTTALSMQIRFARIIAEITSTVYGTTGKLNKKFVLGTKAVLQSIVSVADELRTFFPLHNDERFDGISRQSAHLHLSYYQCIVLATRPLLLCCLIKTFESPLEADSLIASPKVRNPVQMCAESSIQILHILDRLRVQGLLETFLPLDLDSLFVSTVALLVARAVDSRLIEGQSPWLEKSDAILGELVASGNLIAEFRKNETQKLEKVLSEFVASKSQSASGANNIGAARPADLQQADPALGVQEVIQVDVGPVQPESTKPRSSQAEELTAQQIIDVVGSFEWQDNEWMSFVLDDW